MDTDLNTAATATFAAAVATHRDRLQHAYVESDWFPHSAAERPRLRLGTSNRVRLAYEFSLGGLVGFVLAVAVFATGWRLDHLYLTGDNDGLGVMGGLAVGACVWAASSALFGRLIGRYLLNPTGFATSLYVDIDQAVAELARAATTSPDGARLHQAALATLPGLQALAEEDSRLQAAIDENRYAQHRSDYRETLEAARYDVCTAMLDVAAELIAAAGVVFAARDDLLVELANTPTVQDVVLTDSLVSTEIKEALESARQLLREAAANAL